MIYDRNKQNFRSSFSLKLILESEEETDKNGPFNSLEDTPLHVPKR